MDRWILKSTRPHTNLLIHNIYRPQRSWGKVIFSQASVILLTGGCFLWGVASSRGRCFLPEGCFLPAGALLGGGGGGGWSSGIWTCLCGWVISIIHLPTLILTCLWTSGWVLTKALGLQWWPPDVSRYPGTMSRGGGTVQCIMGNGHMGIPKQNDRQTSVKTLPSRNFVSWWLTKDVAFALCSRMFPPLT